MALTTPILYPIPAFDSTDEQMFSFDVFGGDQVVKNVLTIKKQSDDSTVYQHEQIGFSYFNILPSGILTNGEYYYAYINTYNSNNDSSLNSNSIEFHCYTTPSFGFTNFPSGTGIINNSSFTFIVEYNQSESEKLNSYIFNLYDTQNILVNTSGIMYVENSETLPTVISYTFTGLDNNVRYYIKVLGITEENTEISTSYESFYVQYIQPNIFSIVELNNNCEGGYITIKSNFSEIDGITPFSPVYVDDNTAIDLRSVGNYVLWNEGFSINSDFTASLWGHNFNDNSKIVEFIDNNGNTLKVNYKYYDQNLRYVELIVINNNVIYYLYSDKVYIESNDNIQIWIRRVNELYQIDLYNLT